MARRARIAAALACLVLVSMAAPLSAQPKELLKLESTGKVVGVKPGFIAVRSDNPNFQQVPIVLKVDKKTLVQVTGEADASVLRSGMFVRFNANLDKRGKAHGEVEELTLFSPAEGFQAGVMAADEGGVFGEGGGNDLPGAALLDDDEDEKPAEDDETAKGDGPADEDESARPARPQVPTTSSFVSGQIRGMRKNTLTIVAGRAGTIKVDVAEGARVKIDTANYGLAAQGDHIEFEMSYYMPKAPAQFLPASARSVTIELAPREAPVDPKKARALAAQQAKEGGAPDEDPFNVAGKEEPKEDDEGEEKEGEAEPKEEAAANEDAD